MTIYLAYRCVTVIECERGNAVMASSAGPGACYNLIPLPAALPAQSLDQKKKTLKLNKVVFQLNFRLFFTLSSLFFHYFTNPASSFSFTATLTQSALSCLNKPIKGVDLVHSLSSFSFSTFLVLGPFLAQLQKFHELICI